MLIFDILKAMQKKLKVGVVYGGPSSEYKVSVNSGMNVLRYLDKKKYVSVALQIPKRGDWLVPFIKKIKKVDVAFLALHGRFGEDGKIQAVLDALRILYTGSGVRASSIAMDKAATYQMLSCARLHFPKSQLLRSKKQEIKIGFPVVVKPNASGSSIGVSIVKNKKALKRALTKAFREDHEVLLEQYISGKEFTCGVLGNSKKDIKALPVVEIRPAEPFFNYKAKYFDSRTKEICPAPITKKLEKQIKEIAKFVHARLGCRGLTRSDFIVQKGRIYFFEINTIPGQTEESLCPKMATAMGWSLQDFFDTQIQLAVKKD